MLQVTYATHKMEQKNHTMHAYPQWQAFLKRIFTAKKKTFILKSERVGSPW